VSFAAELDAELSWTRRHLRRTARALDDLPGFDGARFALNVHLDTKLIPVFEGLLARGAELHVTTCNPATVRDSVAERAGELGAEVVAAHDMSEQDWRTSIADALSWEPAYLCEMGAAISVAAHREGKTDTIRASEEITGSGIAALETLELRYPVLDIDRIPVKTDLHNRHLVGDLTWQTLCERTHLTLFERTVLVVGYGPVGQGVALAARARGGTVIVAELEPARQITAAYDGFPVMAIVDALPRSDVVVTATGATHVVGAEHVPLLRDGCVLLNVGHRNDEIDTGALYAFPHDEVLAHVDEIHLDHGTVFVIARGAMANLAAGWGDGLNTFDTTLAVIVAGIGALPSLAELGPGIHAADPSIWEPAVRSI
jgi:adenosylhomocysteinase